VAIVTGGASGIGCATIELLRKEGATVVITDRNEPADRNFQPFLLHDITKEKQWDHVVGWTLGQYGKLDILVNCAGINGACFKSPQDPEHLSLEQFREVMSVNGEGTFLGCRSAVVAMKEKGGNIVNIGSIITHVTTAVMLDYAASKSVINYLTRSVALYCADRGYDIRCNLVTPGATYTPLWDTLFEGNMDRKHQENTVREKIPLKRWTMPIDVAYAVLYLASDEARCVTGAEIIVDGGQVIKGQNTR